MKIDLAFANRELEKQFYDTLIKKRNEEIGGILFWKWGQLNNLHWKRHEAIFGDRSIGLISDWLICPNVSNLRDREYSVSDLRQLIAIAEQTAESRRVSFIHFHSHPPTGSRAPSVPDMNFWKLHFSDYGWARGAIAQIDHGGELYVHCYTNKPSKHNEFEGGRFLDWSFITYKIRRYYNKYPNRKGA